MALSFTRKVNISPGIQGSGDIVDAAHINELQVALEGITTGTQPIPLAGIEGALVGRNEASRTLNLLDYNPAGDGVTDDIAKFQLAIADLATLGGGTLIIPPAQNGDDYLWSSGVTHGGMVQQLQIYSDDITIEFLPGARVRSTLPGARVIIAAGAFKPDGVANWGTNGPLHATGYDLSGTFAKNTNVITTATASDAGNFAAGDDILIRTGQTLATGTGEPVSELNIVASADADTGDITLLYPLAHTYEQEYFISGTAGRTNATPTANPSLFQCHNVTDRTLRRFTLINPKVTVDYSGTTFSQVLSIWDGHTYRIENPDLTYVACGLGGRATHHVVINNWESHHTLGADAQYAIAPSWGCSAWDVDGIDITSEGQQYLHLHEGVAASRFKNGTIRSGATDSDLISIRARTEGVVVSDIDLHAVMTTDGNVLSVDEYCTGGGVIERVRAYGTGGAVRFRIDAPGWRGLETCETPNGRISLRAATQGYGHETGGRALTGWVSGTTGAQFLTPSLGTVPEYGMVLRVHCHVYEAFDSDGSDEIVVGYSGSTNAFATAIDVSTTGVKSVTLGSAALVQQLAARTVFATYTAGGSAPTQGKALVTVEYALAARRD